MSIIREAASKSSSLSWRTYDEQFRLRQAANVQSRGAINQDLWLRIMTMPAAPFQAETPTVRKNTCFYFNNGSCHWNSCKFPYFCSNCGGSNYGRRSCFQLNKGTSFRRPRGFCQCARGGRPFPRRGNSQ